MNTNLDNSINIINANLSETNTNKSYLGPASKLSKNEINFDMLRRDSKVNIMCNLNKTQLNPNINIITKNETSNDTRESKKKTNLDNTVIYNENYKSPDLSYLTNNLLSPYSYRVDPDRSHINYNNYNLLNISKLNPQLGNNRNNMTYDGILSQEYPFTISNYITESFLDENFIENHPEVINKIKEGLVYIKEEHDKLKKLKEELVKGRESKNITIISKFNLKINFFI